MDIKSVDGYSHEAYSHEGRKQMGFSSTFPEKHGVRAGAEYYLGCIITKNGSPTNIVGIRGGNTSKIVVAHVIGEPPENNNLLTSDIFVRKVSSTLHVSAIHECVLAVDKPS